MKTIVLFITLIIFTLNPIYGQVHFSEDFQNGDTQLPPEWMTSSVGDIDWEVTYRNADPYIPFTDGYYVIFNDNEAGPDNNNSGILTSPIINLEGISTASLRFDYFNLNSELPSSLRIEVYDGNSWIEVFYTDAMVERFQMAQIDISSYINPTFRVRFIYDDQGNWAYGCGIDNIQVLTLQENDIKIEVNDVNEYNLIHEEFPVTIQLTNTGNNRIESVSLEWVNQSSTSVSNLDVDLLPGARTNLEYPVPLVLTETEFYLADIVATSVNGMTDPMMENNSTRLTTRGISQLGVKRVLIEEATGTWCGYCPKGIVAMGFLDFVNHENFEEQYSIVSVHYDDPMELEEYSDSMNNQRFPSVNVDRKYLGQNVYGFPIFYPTSPSHLDLNMTGMLNGNNLTLNAQATSYTNLTIDNFSDIDYRFAVILTENAINGNTSGYNQNNSYSGNINTPMGGFENLSNPVPASQMNYNFVGRALLGGYDGVLGSFPRELYDGQTVEYQFNYVIPENFDSNNMNAILIVIDNQTGRIVNSFQMGVENLRIMEEIGTTSIFSIYPNPSIDMVNVKIHRPGEYQLRILNVSGQIVFQRKIDMDMNNKPIDVSGLPKGMYILSLASNTESFSEKLIIK